MKHKEHKRLDLIVFGKEYPEVHNFLDIFFIGFHQNTRRLMHHKEGLQIIYSLFGNEIRDVAELHIRADFYGAVPQAKDMTENRSFPLEFKNPMEVLKDLTNG